jgi:ABC-type multidrug transport system fused ATPase/permease subunit
MFKVVKESLAFMTPKERSTWYLLTILRSLLSLIDFAGVLAIGFIFTSTALFLTQGSDPDRIVEFAGISLPSVNAQTLPLFGILVLLLFLGKALFSLLLTRGTALYLAKVEARSARRIAEIVFGGTLSNARRRSREEMLYAIQNGSPAAFNNLLNAASTIVTEVSLFVVISLGFLLVDPVSTIAAIAYFVLIALTIQFFLGTLMQRAGQILTASSVEANAALSDLTTVFRELSVLGKRQEYIERIYQARLRAADGGAAQYYLSGIPRYIVEAALLIGIALFVVVQYLTTDLIAAAGTISVFVFGGFRLTAAILPLQSSILTVSSLIPVANSALAILATSSRESSRSDFRGGEVSGSEQTLNTPEGGVEVELSNIFFSFEDSTEPVVHGINLRIPPGTQAALMGPSGAGKSTLADIMCAVLEPSIGQVLINGSNPFSSNAKLFPIGYVPQKPGLVSGTISDNVALGVSLEDVNVDQVRSALASAHLLDVIENLPEGINAPLGKLLDGLSGGQVQRLGLARALYSNPGLLVMDEATSALDAESEAEIQKVLDGLRGKVTVVLIAHRVNTIQNADVVFLMEEGKLVDQGTFQELLRRNASVERVVELMRVRTD